MLCDECQQEESTVFLTQIVDGQTTSTHYCARCAGPIVEALQQQLVQAGAAGNGPLPVDAIYERLTAGDNRFAIAAFRFVQRAVCVALSNSHAAPGDHVSGRDVAEAFRSLALSEFGTTALPTLASWGIHSTDDIGAVLFRMIELGIFGARPEDTPADFHALYDFASAFPTGA